MALLGDVQDHAARIELTRDLRRHGEPVPDMLFVSARRAPSLPSAEPPMHVLDEPGLLAVSCNVTDPEQVEAAVGRGETRQITIEPLSSRR